MSACAIPCAAISRGWFADRFPAAGVSVTGAEDSGSINPKVARFELCTPTLSRPGTRSRMTAAEQTCEPKEHFRRGDDLGNVGPLVHGVRAARVAGPPHE